jgi:hypothetical protein
MNINEPLSSIKNANKHYLRDISDEKNKKKWVDILTKTPNKALEEYHSILCKNNSENEGYCNLLDLFKILGALEQLNKQNDVVKQVKETYEKEKQTMTQELRTTHQKEKEELQATHQKEKEELQAQSNTKTEQLKDENDTLKEKQNSTNSDLIKINKAVEDLLEYINQMSEIVGKDKKSMIKEARKKIQRGMSQPSGKTKEEIIENVKNIQGQQP